MAGVEQVGDLMAAQSAEEARSLVDEPAISYARVFAENGAHAAPLGGARGAKALGGAWGAPAAR